MPKRRVLRNWVTSYCEVKPAWGVIVCDNLRKGKCRKAPCRVKCPKILTS